MAKKPTAADAQLLLQLYDLRREPEMRKARAWWTGEFFPESADDIMKVVFAMDPRRMHGFAKWAAIGVLWEPLF
jgi:hypothetical protein